MTTEIEVLGWSVLLLLLHIAVQGALTARARGARYNAGPRDEGQPPPGRYAGRAQRALANFMETYPAFVGLALALVVTGRTGGDGALGALLWIGGRSLFLPLYLAGTPWLRSAAWGVAVAGLLLMLLPLL